MQSIVTYYDANSAKGFLSNLSSFIWNCSNDFDSITVFAFDEIYTEDLINSLSQLFQIVTIIKTDTVVNTKDSIQYELHDALLNSLAGLSGQLSYVYVDPFLYFVNEFKIPTDRNTFYIERDSFLSLKMMSIHDSSNFTQIHNVLKLNRNLRSERRIRFIFSELISSNYLISKFLSKELLIDSFLHIRKVHESTKSIDLSRTLAIDMNQANFTKDLGVLKKIEIMRPVKNLIEVKRKLKNVEQVKRPTSFPYLGQRPEGFKISVVYTKQVENQALLVSSVLKSLGFTVSNTLLPIWGQVPKTETDLYILFCANALKNIPNNYICYQFEQAHSNWFKDDYIRTLNGAIDIWDYSEYNINYFRGKFDAPHTFVKIGTPLSYNDDPTNRDIDLLFYGEYHGSQRRKEFIEAVKSKYPNLTVIEGSNPKFGSSIVDLLKRTKIVLNHHYYNNGSLEVVRVYEALNNGCSVISEVSVDDQYHQDLPILKYSTIAQALDLIKTELSKYSPTKFVRDSKPTIKRAIARLGFSVLNRTVIFAHYDLKNQIDDYVVKYLTYLNKITNNIIFVSDCDLPDGESQKIDKLCIKKIIGRHGESNDFGSYKRGLSYLINELPEIYELTDELVFANDSCYCTGDLLEMFTQMSASNYDAWSINDHAESSTLIKNETYLQTSLFVIASPVFKQKKFIDFFSSITPEKTKELIVRKYEIGLSELLIRNGNKLGSYISHKQVKSYVSLNLNKIKDEIKEATRSTANLTARLTLPSVGSDYVYSDHYYTLLKLKSPLIKCLTVVPNTVTTPNNVLINYWYEIVSKELGKETADMILNHILRINKKPHSSK